MLMLTVGSCFVHMYVISTTVILRPAKCLLPLLFRRKPWTQFISVLYEFKYYARMGPFCKQIGVDKKG